MCVQYLSTSTMADDNKDNVSMCDEKSSPSLMDYEQEKYNNFVLFCKGLVAKNKRLEGMIPSDASYTIFMVFYRLGFRESIDYARRGLKLERDISVRSEIDKLIELHDVDNFTTAELDKLCRYMSLFAELA